MNCVVSSSDLDLVVFCTNISGRKATVDQQNFTTTEKIQVGMRDENLIFCQIAARYLPNIRLNTRAYLLKYLDRWVPGYPALNILLAGYLFDLILNLISNRITFI